MTRIHRNVAVCVGGFVAAINTLLVCSWLWHNHPVWAFGYAVLVYWVAYAVAELNWLDAKNHRASKPSS